MHFETYQAVQKLNEQELLQLISSGEEIERIWAAWTLALRRGKKAIPTLSIALNDSPPVGQRRHLIGILAAFGELKIIRVLAKSDPAARVRETACLYLMQSSTKHDDHALLRSILQSDEDENVRALILNEAEKNDVALSVVELVERTHDDASIVRRAALESIRNQNNAAEAIDLGLAPRLSMETVPELVSILIVIFIDVGQAEIVLKSMTHWDAAKQKEALDYLAKK